MDAALGDFLDKHAIAMSSCAMQANTAGFLQKLTEGIKKSLEARYRRRKAWDPSSDPFGEFCRKHLSAPEYPILIRSNLEGNKILKRKTIGAMSRRG